MEGGARIRWDQRTEPGWRGKGGMGGRRSRNHGCGRDKKEIGRGKRGTNKSKLAIGVCAPRTSFLFFKGFYNPVDLLKTRGQ